MKIRFGEVSFAKCLNAQLCRKSRRAPKARESYNVYVGNGTTICLEIQRRAQRLGGAGGRADIIASFSYTKR